MSNSTSAGLPTLGEMVEFINNQELIISIYILNNIFTYCANYSIQIY